LNNEEVVQGCELLGEQKAELAQLFLYHRLLQDCADQITFVYEYRIKREHITMCLFAKAKIQRPNAFMGIPASDNRRNLIPRQRPISGANSQGH
jgi:hypothetical protein